jgi:segregation and condensation protein B
MEVDVPVKDDMVGQGSLPASDLPIRSRKGLPLEVEALMLTFDRPVSAGRIAEALGLTPPSREAPPAVANTPEVTVARRRKKQDPDQPAQGAAMIDEVIAGLNKEYTSTGRSFRIEAVAGGYRLMTLPVFAPIIAAFHRSRSAGRLSRAAVETLAIVAYKQPITRAHLEAIRGVACGEVLRSLMERRLVVIKGRAEELGRPILYGTSKEFLDAFGLSSLKDLPTAAELQIAL